MTDKVPTFIKWLMNVQRDIEANKTIVVNMQWVKIRVLYNYKTTLYATLI